MTKFRTASHIQRYILTGIFTLVPIWITYLVFEFLYTELSKIGKPGAIGIAASLNKINPMVSEWLNYPFIQSTLAVLLTLVISYLLGWTATRVLGRRLLNLFDAFMVRIPMVHTIYGATKKLMESLQKKPDGMQRAVLIRFPSPHLRSVGLLTKILTDKTTGQQLGAVFVPTSPNPTSGYMQIIPVDEIVYLDWSMDEVMTFIVTGGVVSPDRI